MFISSRQVNFGQVNRTDARAFDIALLGLVEGMPRGDNGKGPGGWKSGKTPGDSDWKMILDKKQLHVWYIFTYIYLKNGPNAGKYSIYGAYGRWFQQNFGVFMIVLIWFDDFLNVAWLSWLSVNFFSPSVHKASQSQRNLLQLSEFRSDKGARQEPEVEHHYWTLRNHQQTQEHRHMTYVCNMCSLYRIHLLYLFIYHLFLFIYLIIDLFCTCFQTMDITSFTSISPTFHGQNSPVEADRSRASRRCTMWPRGCWMRRLSCLDRCPRRVSFAARGWEMLGLYFWWLELELSKKHT